MNNRRIVVTVLITIVLLAILTAGGFAFYRLGYVRGMSQSAGGFMMQGFDGRFGDDRGMPFHDFAGPGRLRERMPMTGFAHPGFSAHTPFGGFSGLLLLIGVIALVVIAVNGLSRNRKQNVSMEPAPLVEDPKPRRRTPKATTDR
jgi:hypothetical protein